MIDTIVKRKRESVARIHLIIIVLCIASLLHLEGESLHGKELYSCPSGVYKSDQIRLQLFGITMVTHRCISCMYMKNVASP